MYPEVLGCCKKPTAWIFIYQNDVVYSICQKHFYSNAHRYDVKEVINFQTKIPYNPTRIFEDYPIRFRDDTEVPKIV